MQSVLKIGNFELKNWARPFIMAEVGLNHNGELAKAFEMIEAAKNCGVDAVKFQTFSAAEFVGDPKQTYTYKSQGKEVTECMLDMFQRCEFHGADWDKIKKKCQDEGVMFLSSPQNVSDLNELLRVGVPAIKVGSDDFVNTELLKAYAETKLPLMVSCGMSDLGEVYRSLEAIGTFDGYPTVLFLCTSEYPTPPESVNMRKLRTLMEAFPGLPLGFSDHTEGSLAAALAVSYGACIFEKHFTLSHDLPGPDHWFSADPAGLKAWVDAIRTAHKMLGSPLVRPTRAEAEMRTLARRSIVALRDIASGEILGPENIGLRRPGNGLPSSFMGEISGRRASSALKNGQLIKIGDFA